MNISSVSSTSIATLSSVSGANQVSSSQDPDADGDGQMHVHHGGHHRGGAVGSAMMAALQSLGLSIPPPAAGGTSGSAATAGGPSSFATGLSALITQVANGSAPSDLQSAFSQLVQDAGATGT